MHETFYWVKMEFTFMHAFLGIYLWKLWVRDLFASPIPYTLGPNTSYSADNLDQRVSNNQRSLYYWLYSIPINQYYNYYGAFLWPGLSFFTLTSRPFPLSQNFQFQNHTWLTLEFVHFSSSLNCRIFWWLCFNYSNCIKWKYQNYWRVHLQYVQNILIFIQVN